MCRGWLAGLLLLWLVVSAVNTSWAQQRSIAPNQPSIMNEEEDAAPPAPAGKAAKSARGLSQPPALETDPDLDAADQLAPSQIRQPIPAAVAEPTGPGRTRATRGAALESGVEPRTTVAAKSESVACNGVFARDSSHAQVDGPAGAKIMATVLFAKDPKRRLEVWWANQASRTDTHLIVINGASTWSAPSQLRLGLTLAQLEQINGKPFKLTGFDKNNVATLTDWNGGNLSLVPGGCKVGISLRPGTVSPAALGALPANREFTSSDSAMRTVNPAISEILIGY
jgi:hypothetical protein